MNFPGKFEQDSSLSHFGMHADLGSSSLDGHANTVTIPNGHLLFSGDYERSGLDLIVSDHDHRVVIHDYFRGEQRPTLVSPEGAPLDPSASWAIVRSPLTAARATFALKAGEWFRRGRLLMVSPVHGDYRRCQAEIPLIVLFQISGTGSESDWVISARGRGMALFNKVFSTRTLLQIICVLGAVVVMKVLSAHYDFSWAAALAAE
jgi:hypothetical protein